MKTESTNPNLAHPFCPVKSFISDDKSVSSFVMTHHKVPGYKRLGKRIIYRRCGGGPYGVSLDHKILTKGLLQKKWDYIRDCLINVCGLTATESSVALVLLRQGTYYPQVYPKAAQVAEEAHCSISTFWRAVGKLRGMNLLEVVHRFLIRVEAQISNLYLLNKLLIVIAKYLAEHISHVWAKWLLPVIKIPWPDLWGSLGAGQESRASPLPL